MGLANFMDLPRQIREFETGQRSISSDNPFARVSPLSAAKDPEETFATLTRAQWDDYVNRFRPIEDEVLSQLTGEGQQERLRTEGDAASARVRRQYNIAHGGELRNLGRTGLSLNAAERAALDRRRAISQSADEAGAENLTRRGLVQADREALTQMVATGRNVLSAGMGGLNNAASMAHNREMAYQQAKSQWRSSLMQVAGIGTGLFFGG